MWPTEVTVESGTSNGASWSLATRPSHAGLTGHVGEYVGYEELADGPVRRRELPSGAVTLILGLGEPLEVRSANRSGPPDRLQSFVAGMHDVHTDTEHGGRQCGIEVRLTPVGASRLLGVAASDMANTAVPIDCLRGRDARELVERLACLPDWPSRFELLDRTFLRWADGGPDIDPAIRWAWHQIDRSHGQVLVSTLAEEIGWSRRYFANRFRNEIGLAPKTTGRVLRFRRAVELLLAGDHASISDVAAAGGYADHSHLARECRALAGCTPSELLAERLGDDLGEAFPVD